MTNPFKKIFKKEVPINGGNAFELQKILDNKEQQIRSFVNLENIQSPLTAQSYNEWELLNMQADYFTSIFPVTFEDSYIDRIVYTIFRVNFLYGNCGIYLKDDKLIPIIEEQSDIALDGKLNKVVGYSAFEVLALKGTLNDNKDRLKSKITITKSSMENYIRLTADTYGFGAIIKWWKFVQLQCSILKKINHYSYLLNRKVVYECNSISAARSEILAFFNDNSPFIVRTDTLSPNSNKFRVDGFENIKSDDVFSYYYNWLKSYYELLGRRINVDFKKERNITSEVEASQNQFEVLENEQRINKTNFLNDLAKAIQKDWKNILQNDAESSNQNESAGKETGELEQDPESKGKAKNNKKVKGNTNDL